MGVPVGRGRGNSRLALGVNHGFAVEDAEDIAFLDNQEVLPVGLDLGAGPLAVKDPIALLDSKLVTLAVGVARTRPDGNDFTFGRFFPELCQG